MMLADLVTEWREEAELFRRRGLSRIATLIESLAAEVERAVADDDSRADLLAAGQHEALERWARDRRYPHPHAPGALQGIEGLKPLEVVEPCVVYFLTRGEDVVYVGTSSRWPARVARHLREGEKDFDGVWYIEVERDEALEMERNLIRKYRPEYNVRSMP